MRRFLVTFSILVTITALSHIVWANDAIITDEMYDSLKAMDNENIDRMRFVYRLAREAEQKLGIAQTVRLDDVFENGRSDLVPNVVASVKGETAADSIIVIGAHLDKVELGDGKVDDGAGCVVSMKLYEYFSRSENRPAHTLLFVNFSHEEDGLLGSRSFVNKLRSVDLLESVKAMINIEVLAVTADQLFIWRNGATQELESMALSVGSQLGANIVSRDLYGVGADSVPFFNAGIPAITIDGLPAERFSTIHSPQDTIEAIQKQGLLTAYNFLKEYIKKVDDDPPRGPEGKRYSPEAIEELPIQPFHPVSTIAEYGLLERNNDLFIKAIHHASQEWELGIRTGNAEAVADLYVEHAYLLTPEGKLKQDRDEIKEHYQTLINAATKVELRSINIEVRGSLAYEIGKYEVFFKDGSSSEIGRTAVVWEFTESKEARFLIDHYYQTESNK